ncbi:beta-ketoacyl synthase N-terminal-like domain-containing protein [Paraglaciecola aquimarina]|uniref:Beta-ketoacyl synthase N-terminal-like domain-containing protein n=1 Tax=Paraglaciecola aquimarina TaxID=1235557 RepID=A0ABU3SSQ1_9ALTE|nr:beta-ketoacyl synthase N-terminal-like domain-containing protein [Paraglaciecola aquimarina]MDU0353039.1 beta-ketoacyl synthase N-terminal-like domain-containing protein [Paraglaciecola aquimarina]
MNVYIHSSLSHTACGSSKSQPLRFHNAANCSLLMPDQVDVPFYSMQGIDIDTSEQRVFDSLTTVTKQLIENSGLPPSELKNTALMLGSTSLDIGTIEPNQGQNIWLPKIDRLSQHLQQSLGLSPCHLIFNTACTASINALIYGKKLLQHSQFRHLIVVGCEFYNHLTVDGFHSLDLISKGRLSPFETGRDGLILGEGIGALLLSKDKPNRERYFSLLGGHSACDTSSLTMTAEDGSHITQVLNQAIARSNLTAADINLVKVHGTATYNNDISEYNALLQSFSTPPPIIALKPFIGHTLGACGAIEIALMDTLLCAENLPLIETGATDKMLPFAATDRALYHYKNMLINHCGFGGNNAALVLTVVTA